MKTFFTHTNHFLKSFNAIVFLFAVLFLLFSPVLSHTVLAEDEIDQIKIINWQLSNQILELDLMALKEVGVLVYINGGYVGQAKIIDSNNKYNLLEFSYNKLEESGNYTLKIISQNKNNQLIERDIINLNYFANIKENIPESPILTSLEKEGDSLILKGFYKNSSNIYFYLNKVLVKNPVIIKDSNNKDGKFTAKLKYYNTEEMCVYAYTENNNKLSDRSGILCYKDDALLKKEQGGTKNNNILDNKEINLETKNKKDDLFIRIKSLEKNSNINKPELETVISLKNCNKVSLYIDNALFKTKNIFNNIKEEQEIIFKNSSLLSGKHSLYAKCINNHLNTDKSTEMIEINFLKPEIGSSIKEIVSIEAKNTNDSSLNKNSKTIIFLTSNEKFIFLIFILIVLLWLFWNNKNIIEKNEN
ncbi:hypothetical protein K8R61_03180 [bacterium]|nr:hypothetical protein [bacterium]